MRDTFITHLNRCRAVKAIDRPVRAALLSFANDVLDGSWSGQREREAVRLFAFGPLLRQVDPEEFLKDPTQIALEVPIPQVGVGDNKSQTRRKSQVCKDLIVWPDSQMTCWDQHNNPTVPPAAVLEWKFDSNGVSQRYVNWLRAFTKDYSSCIGYAVTANSPESDFRLTCTRISVDQEQPEWVHVP